MEAKKRSARSRLTARPREGQGKGCTVMGEGRKKGGVVVVERCKRMGRATLSTSERLCTRLKGFSLDFISHPITWHTLGHTARGAERVQERGWKRHEGGTSGCGVKIHKMW